MAKFLDKKERVVDFKLTPYGKHKLAVGKFKPTYYSFFDNGVVYDNEPALSKYLGDVRKVPPHGVGGEGNVGYTWKDWYNFYGPSGHNYLVQWIAQEFQNAKDPSPFPPNF